MKGGTTESLRSIFLVIAVFTLLDVGYPCYFECAWCKTVLYFTYLFPFALFVSFAWHILQCFVDNSLFYLLGNCCASSHHRIALLCRFPLFIFCCFISSTVFYSISMSWQASMTACLSIRWTLAIPYFNLLLTCLDSSITFVWTLVWTLVYSLSCLLGSCKNAACSGSQYGSVQRQSYVSSITLM